MKKTEFMSLSEKQLQLLREYIETNDPNKGIELGRDLLASNDKLLQQLGKIWIEVMEREKSESYK